MNDILEVGTEVFFEVPHYGGEIREGRIVDSHVDVEEMVTYGDGYRELLVTDVDYEVAVFLGGVHAVFYVNEAKVIPVEQVDAWLNE